MEDLARLALAFGFVLLLGSAVRGAALGQGALADQVERLAVAYGLGAASLTLWMLLISWVGVGFTLATVGAVLPLAGVVWMARTGAPFRPRAAVRQAHHERINSSPDRPSSIEWVSAIGHLPLVVGIALLGAAAFIALTRPETEWDTIGTWGLMSKAFFLHRSVWLWDFDAHNYYPLHVPLLGSWIYLALDRWDDVLAKTTTLAYGAALLALIYRGLRRGSVPAPLAGTATLLVLVGSNQLTQQLYTTQADLTLTFYLTAAALNLWWWLSDPPNLRESWRLPLAGLMAGAASWTKYEGFFLAGLLGLALVITLPGSRRLSEWLKPAIVYGSPSASRSVFKMAKQVGGSVASSHVLVPTCFAIAPTALWALFRTTHGIQVEEEHLGGALLAPRTLAAVTQALVALVADSRSGWLWLAVLATGLLFPLTLFAPRYRFLTLAVGLNLAVIPYSLSLNPTDPLGQVSRAGGRLMMHVAPLGVVLLAHLTWDSFQQARRSRRERTLGFGALPTRFLGARAFVMGGLVAAAVLDARGGEILGTLRTPVVVSGEDQRLNAFVEGAREILPPDASYLFQDPWGRGRAHRVRYLLYPRRYERLDPGAVESEVRAFIRDRQIDAVLVFDLQPYGEIEWVRADRPWFRRVQIREGAFALEVLER